MNRQLEFLINFANHYEEDVFTYFLSSSIFLASRDFSSQVETPRPTVSARSPTTTFPSTFTTVPLNMERLWAGDLTQLPANQQLQALNLTSGPTGLAPNPALYPNKPPSEAAAASGATQVNPTYKVLFSK